ncbi:Crp/Fnr family transcriptional regulator [Bacteroidota bacterium]
MRCTLVSKRLISESFEIKKRHLRGRIAYILLIFANEIYFKDEFELPVSRKEIAEFIGITTENVIRTLSEFRKDNLIKIYGKLIKIIDKERLKRISDLG